LGSNRFGSVALHVALDELGRVAQRIADVDDLARVSMM
jgi:hypothetical protein